MLIPYAMACGHSSFPLSSSLISGDLGFWSISESISDASSTSRDAKSNPELSSQCRRPAAAATLSLLPNSSSDAEPHPSSGAAEVAQEGGAASTGSASWRIIIGAAGAILLSCYATLDRGPSLVLSWWAVAFVLLPRLIAWAHARFPSISDGVAGDMDLWEIGLPAVPRPLRAIQKMEEVTSVHEPSIN